MMQFISILLGIQVNTVLLGFLFFFLMMQFISYLTRNSSKHSVVGFSVFFS